MEPATTPGDATPGPEPGSAGSPAVDPTRTSLDGVHRLAPGALLAGRYRIRELLGVGGMGMVYRAQDERLDLPVAIKVLRPEMAREKRFLERFQKELVLARQVTHRNAVRIHDIGQDGDLLFLSMDLVEGRSLREVLESEGPLPVERAVEIAGQLAAALDAAHAEGVVHRDLKPANVLLEEGGRAYITDFGVARSLHSPGMTRPGAVVGTFDYLSPEQARGEEVDARSDLYALGILLFEMLSGELPFEGASDSEVLAQRLAGRPRDLRALGVEVPGWLRAVIYRLLERDPRRRYGSAAELLADLERRRAGRSSWRLGRPWVLGAAAVLIAAALVVWWLAGRRGNRGIGGVGEAAAGPRHSVAVLPLADETRRPDLAWASTGLAEILADRLAESPGLRVVESLRVSRTLEDLKLPRGPLGGAELRQLAGLLEADRLVAGRVHAAGDRLRVDLELISADLPELPAERLHAEVDGAAQAFRLAEELGTGLRERLQGERPAEPATAAPVAPAALAAYSQGFEQLLRGNAVGAAPALERAVAIDPGFGAAWLRLARARRELGRDEAALEAAQRAVAALGAGRSRQRYEAAALAAQLRGEAKKGQDILAQLVARYPNDAEAKVELAEAFGEQGNLEQAAPLLQAAVRLDPQHPRAWYLLAKYAIEGGQSRQALDEYLVHALAIQNKLGNPQGQANTLNAMGVAQRELGDLAQAEESYGKAAELQRRIGNERGYASSLANLARIHLVRGRHAESAEELGRALAILERLGDKAGAADMLNAFGALAEERGELREALDYYRRSLRARRDLGDDLALAESFSNVGYIHYLLGDFDDALAYWRQGLDLARKGGDARGVVTATQSIGQLQIAQGKWDDALKSMSGTLEESRKLAFKEAVPVSLGELGRIYRLQGRFRAAERSYDEALKILEEQKIPRGIVEFSLAHADLDLEVGEMDEAAKRLDEAERALREGDNREQRVELQRLRGEWLLRRGQGAKAAEALRRAVAEAEVSRGVALLGARLSAAGTPPGGRATRADIERLRGLVEEAATLGHAPLELRAGEILAAAALAAGDFPLAEEAARAALRRTDETGPYAGAYRLHLLLARALEGRGRAAEAAAERQQGIAEIDRLRRDLTAEQRRAFDALPEVRAMSSGATDG